jgi:ribose transport system permease protein
MNHNSRTRIPGTDLRAMRAVQRRIPVVQLLVLVVLCAYAFVTINGLASWPSIRSILVLASFLGITAIGQTIVVLLGGLDLSIPGLILVGAFMTSRLAGPDGLPLWFVVLCIVLVGAGLGFVSGYISFYRRVQPLIATLGVGAIATGGILVWSAGLPAQPVPDALASLTRATQPTFGLPVPPIVVIWVVLIVVIELVLRTSVVGQHVYLTGSNPVAAGLSRVPTGRTWIGAFALSGVGSVLVGVLLAGYGGSAEINLGDPYLFQSLTAVIVGGTAFGARGDYLRTVVGVLILTMLSIILLGNGFTFADQQIVFGLLILAAVFFYGRDRRLADQI